MKPEQKQFVRASWEQVVPVSDQAAAMFYQRLFEIDPEIRALFRTANLVEQRDKLMQVLNVAVASLDNLDALTKMVEELGRRHAGYGVEDEHYDTVGAALLWTLEKGLGEGWTAEVAAAWTEVYNLLSGIMRNAQKAAAACAA